MNRTDPHYALGHSEAELSRLATQANLLAEHTALLFRRAGITRGSSVLDIGCGPGDVSFLTADIVGPTGRVTGIDRSAEAVELARERARQGGYKNVEFRVADVASLPPETQFDAVVGRLVLMYLADPVTALRQLAKVIRPKGMLVLQEGDLTSIASAPECALVQQARRWLLAAFEHSGAATNMGSQLPTIMSRAGLEPEGCNVSQPAYVGPELETGTEWFANVLRSLVPMLDSKGIVAVDTLQIDTLAKRLSAEARGNHAIVFAPRLVGVWARL